MPTGPSHACVLISSSSSQVVVVQVVVTGKSPNLAAADAVGVVEVVDANEEEEEKGKSVAVETAAVDEQFSILEKWASSSGVSREQ